MQFDPDINPKYSPYLYKFLRKYFSERLPSVYKDVNDHLWIESPFKTSQGLLPLIQLSQVLCNGTKVAEYAWVKDKNEFEEVLDFWENYAENGRCTFDEEHTMHFICDETRWKYDGDTRHCLWCGKVTQKLNKYGVTIVKESWKIM